MQSFKFFYHTKAVRRSKVSTMEFFPALIVRCRPKPPQLVRIFFDSFQIPIKRKIKIKPRLFAICDYIESGCNLIMDRRDHSIFDHFFFISISELV